MEIIDRLQAPTPKFFRVLRTIGIALASAGGALLAAPAALPAVLLSIAGYLTVAGTILTAVSQAAKEDPQPQAVPARKARKSTKAPSHVDGA